MARKKPRGLTGAQIVQLAKEWNIKSAMEFAQEFDVSPTTIGKAANGLNKQSDGEFCKPKPRGMRASIIEALNILKDEQKEAA